MSGEWETWGIPGEVADQVIRRLPHEWSITITLQGGNARPYIILHDDAGDCCIDSDGPNTGESVVDCISRLLITAERESR